MKLPARASDLYCGDGRAGKGLCGAFGTAADFRTVCRAGIRYHGALFKGTDENMRIKIGARTCVVLGDNELDTGRALIKSMTDGASSEIALDNINLQTITEFLNR